MTAPALVLPHSESISGSHSAVAPARKLGLLSGEGAGRGLLLPVEERGFRTSAEKGAGPGMTGAQGRAHILACIPGSWVAAGQVA